MSNKVEEATAIKLNLNYLKNNNIIYKGKGNYTKIGIPILSKNKIFLIRTRTLSPSTLFWPLEQHLYPHLHLKVFVKVIWDDEYDEIIVEEYSKKEITWRSTVLI